MIPDATDIVIGIFKAKKRFNRNVNPHVFHSFNRNDKAGFNESDKPFVKNDKPSVTFDRPNKTDSNDNTKDKEMENQKILESKMEIAKFFQRYARNWTHSRNYDR